MAERIAPWASILLPNTSGSKNIYCTESISMGVIPTRTDVISIVCMIAFPAAGTRLTCISWVDIYNFNPCKGSLVLDEFCQTIEAPIMEAVIVFTACSCRLADAGKLLQLDGFYTVRSRVIHDGAAYFMVLVCHPTLFFIARFFNGFQLFRFAEFFCASQQTYGVSACFDDRFRKILFCHCW